MAEPDPEGDEGVMEQLLAVRYYAKKQQIQYRVKWEDGKTTWEPEEIFDGVTDVEDILRRFQEDNADAYGKAKSQYEKAMEKLNEESNKATASARKPGYVIEETSDPEPEVFFGQNPDELSGELKGLYDPSHKFSETELVLAQLAPDSNQRCTRSRVRIMKEDSGSRSGPPSRSDTPTTSELTSPPTATARGTRGRGRGRGAARGGRGSASRGRGGRGRGRPAKAAAPVHVPNETDDVLITEATVAEHAEAETSHEPDVHEHEGDDGPIIKDIVVAADDVDHVEERVAEAAPVVKEEAVQMEIETDTDEVQTVYVKPKRTRKKAEKPAKQPAAKKQKPKRRALIEDDSSDNEEAHVQATSVSKTEIVRMGEDDSEPEASTAGGEEPEEQQQTQVKLPGRLRGNLDDLIKPAGSRPDHIKYVNSKQEKFAKKITEAIATAQWAVEEAAQRAQIGMHKHNLNALIAKAVLEGDFNLLRQCLFTAEEVQVDLFQTNKDGQTLLHRVAAIPCTGPRTRGAHMHVYCDMIDVIGSQDFDPNNPHGRIRFDVFGKTPLHYAMETGGLCKVRRLMLLSVPLNLHHMVGVQIHPQFKPYLQMAYYDKKSKPLARILIDAGVSFIEFEKQVRNRDHNYGSNRVYEDLMKSKKHITSRFKEAKTRVLHNIREIRDVTPIFIVNQHEGPEFHFTFFYNAQHIPDSTYMFFLFVGLARVDDGKWTVALFGDRALNKDPILNGQELDNVQHIEQVAHTLAKDTMVENPSVYLCVPAHGRNDLRIRMSDSFSMAGGGPQRCSKHKYLVQICLVKRNNDEAPVRRGPGLEYAPDAPSSWN